MKQHTQINKRFGHDEVKTFLEARYVSTAEATWRLYDFAAYTMSSNYY